MRGQNVENEIMATTIVAAVFNEGVIIGADMQATMISNLSIYHEQIDKLVEICSNSVVGIAGVPVMIHLVKKAKRGLDNWKKSFGKEVTLEGQYKYLSEHLFLDCGIGHSAILFACYDDKLSRGRIFRAEPGMFGIGETKAGFDAIGSGAEPLLNNLESREFGNKLLYEEAIKMVRESLRFSHKRNAGVGGEFRARVITKDGIRDISAEMNEKEK